ncbi:MAG: exo-alpha-sialidase [Cyclobacteriaceae bacterium]|nr:MAG: exo-alpha-sialidase [Cyclobacteriaceae bacterium]
MKRLILLTVLFAACTSKDATTLVQAPTATGSAEPFLFTDEEGKVYLSWVEKGDSISSLKYSQWDKGNWTTPMKIASGKNWFVNWADYPMLAINKNQFVAHFLERSSDARLAYTVQLTTSADGKTWSEPLVVHDDGKHAEHGFVSLLPYGDNFLVAWLDGRNTGMEGMEDMDSHEGDHGAMSLRAAIINPQGEKLREWELDNKTCDCCQTIAALTNDGPVVIYRDRSDEELRDISIVRLQQDSVWTKPAPVYADNWKIAGCPVNGPRADAIDNTLAIAWFTAADSQPTVKLIFSTDGGKTFDNPIQINTGATIGRVDVLLLDATTALVSWMEDATLKSMRVRRDGSKGKPMHIASTSEARSGGFPQMTKAGDKIVFAWTDTGQEIIQTAFVAISSF